MWVLKHPNTEPISCFILLSSSLLKVIVKQYLLWIAHKFSVQQRLHLAAAHPSGPSSAGPPLQEQWRAQRQCKVCSQLVPSYLKTGPTFPLGEHKTAAAITQLDFSKKTSFTVAFLGEGEGSHSPEFKGPGPSGWEVLGLYKELAIYGTLYSHSSSRCQG